MTEPTNDIEGQPGASFVGLEVIKPCYQNLAVPGPQTRSAGLRSQRALRQKANSGLRQNSVQAALISPGGRQQKHSAYAQQVKAYRGKSLESKIFGHKDVSLCWGATSRHLLCLQAPWQLSSTGSSQAPGLFAAARRAQLTKRNLIPGAALRATSGRPTLQPPSLLGAAPSPYPGSGGRRSRTRAAGARQTLGAGASAGPPRAPHAFAVSPRRGKASVRYELWESSPSAFWLFPRIPAAGPAEGTGEFQQIWFT
ncbi:uncharacterized protein [Kogia breviceps]|uniref:uncharacterized protein n=1 Tax=Kogia breviceps TaxID=27615 RepID=UPI0034D2E053